MEMRQAKGVEPPLPSITPREAVRRMRGMAMFVLVIILSVKLFSKNGIANSFQFHVICMSAAVLMALPGIMESVASFRSKREALPRDEKVLRHQFAAFVFELLTGVGFYAVYSFKNSQGYPHLATPHALMGAACGACIVAEVCLGVTLNYILPVESPKRPLVKRLHGLVSVCISVTILLCFFGGMMSTHYAEENLPLILRQVMTLAAPVVLFIAYVF